MVGNKNIFSIAYKKYETSPGVSRYSKQTKQDGGGKLHDIKMTNPASRLHLEQ
jgi:hypothetical protein